MFSRVLDFIRGGRTADTRLDLIAAITAERGHLARVIPSDAYIFGWIDGVLKTQELEMLRAVYAGIQDAWKGNYRCASDDEYDRSQYIAQSEMEWLDEDGLND